MSGSWDDEQARVAEHRRHVEERARSLPRPPERGSGRARRVARLARPVASLVNNASAPLRRHGQRTLLAARSWGRRPQGDPQLGPTATDGLAPSAVASAPVTCIVVGAPGGPAERAARATGNPVVVTADLSVAPALGPHELVCLMAATTEPLTADWLDRLAAIVLQGPAAASPTLVHPRRSLFTATPFDGLVRDRGLVLTVHDDAPVLHARGAGDSPTVLDSPSGPMPIDQAQPTDGDEVDALSGACIVVSRRAIDEAGGLPVDQDIAAVVLELSLRLHDSGRRLVATRSVLAVDHRPIGAAAELETPFGLDDPVWRGVIDRRGPALLRRASRDVGVGDGDRLRFALTIAAPSEKLAPRWGDWHLAGALARALERLGHIARLQTADHADDAAGRACDVHLVLRGLQPVRRTAGQRHALWIISHPEAVDPAECDDADLVLVASERFANHLRARTSTPVEVMLQATDQHRFRRVPPRPEHEHPIAVVAKTRDVVRPIVVDAIASGLRPAIYGTGWEQFVDPSLIVAQYVPNESLPQIYSSVGVLLNDHWESMRTWGFVSNRLFDALACGTPIISDPMPEIFDLFGDAVSVAHDARDLRAHADELLADLGQARTRAARGTARVLAGHTFDDRARQLMDVLTRHGLHRGAA